MDLQSLFISNLKRIRKSKKITQETLAELCGTDTSYISQIEIKRRFPSISLIERLAESLGVEPYVLFKDEGEKPQEESPADDAKKNASITRIQKELLPLLQEDLEKVLKRCL